MERLQLIKSITFGAPIAEDETSALGKYFVETDQWDRIFRGELDIIRGDKGSGKSAIYSLLAERTDDLFDRRVLLTTGENPRGATVFAELVSEPPTTEREFILLWKLYIVTVIARTLSEFDLAGSKFKRLTSILKNEGLLERGFDLKRIFQRVRRYVRLPKSLEGSMSVDPNTLLSTATGKITFGEPSVEAEKKGAISLDRLAELTNDALADANFSVWVLLDRLDVAFVESHDLEKNALRALFRVYRDFAALDHLRLKIFLRADIWSRIMEGGFREASHISRVADLTWDQRSLLNLIVRRVLNNESLVKEMGLDAKAILADFNEQTRLFYRLFPSQVEQGTKKRLTLDWIINRCADGQGKTAPREVIQLLNKVREHEIQRLEIGEEIPTGEQLFDRGVFKPALASVSNTRLKQTIFAEYPYLKPYLERLIGAKTEHTTDSLQAAWNLNDIQTSELVKVLIEIGFFQARGARSQTTYWVPFLYRDALEMSQGLADE